MVCTGYRNKLVNGEKEGVVIRVLGGFFLGCYINVYKILETRMFEGVGFFFGSSYCWRFVFFLWGGY